MIVSVVIPSYNHERYVVDAVQSVLTQTYSNIELIVIDDGSADQSVERLSAIRDPRLKLIVQENQGAHAAINHGLSLAQGDYLAILNSDDLYHPERVERGLNFMDERGAELVCSWIQIIDADGAARSIKQGWQNMRPRWAAKTALPAYWDLDDFSLNLLSSNFVSTTSNMLFRRAVYESVGGMRNLRFSHDWDFMLRVASAHTCMIIPEALMQYRLHGTNTISTNERWMLFETCWVLAANLDRYEGTKLFGGALSEAQLAEAIQLMSRSVNVAKCERMFPLLRSYIAARRKAIGMNADEELLANADLRQVFIDLIDP